MNIGFGNNPKHLIILENGLWHTEYFVELFNNVDKNNSIKFYYIKGNVNEKDLSNWMAPYSINITPFSVKNGTVWKDLKINEYINL